MEREAAGDLAWAQSREVGGISWVFLGGRGDELVPPGKTGW